ncbi:hypothetical protein CKM354_000976000 [Cercospora kikuchii]|uniref:Uncharacterized protein n=1 Tax=Cercospora kikuchii TaxID=84275 RepID=A0A9P3CQ63_9PEZI|nr:uncharacterized protein CKM354_000976000 [Cercospora kikuchii]GIZ46641.1 hypothetical protein CKM354_000976000 [Cercospora kikuchii]
MMSKAQRPKRKRNTNVNSQAENEFSATSRDQTKAKRKRDVNSASESEYQATNHDQIDLAIDWGTWKFVVAYALSRNGVRNDPKPLIINEQTYEVRMMATWIDGRFVHGHELQNAADSRHDLKIIDFPKLPLYQGPETSEITKRVTNTLAELPGNKTLDLLIQEHLHAIVEDAKSALRNTDLKVHYRDDPRQLENLLDNIHVRITIPQMWTPDAKRRMQIAAKNAGLRVSVLLYEPQCALAYLIDAASKEKVEVGPLSEGDSILVADLGCGTGDFVLRELNLEPREFERRVLTAIEEGKQKFGRKNQNFTTCTIQDAEGEHRTFQFKRVEFHEAFDEVIAKIIEQIERITQGTSPTVIQVTGGFSKCGYLMAALRDRFQPGSSVVRPSDPDNADCFPVALGALLRYENITMPALPSKYGFALLQRQEYDEDVHSDAWYDLKGYDEDDIDRKTRPWVMKEPYGRGFDVVDHRIVNIIRKDQELRPNQVVSQPIDHIYNIPCDDPRLSDEFCYLTKTFEDHVWAKTNKKDANGEYMWKAGVRPWTAVNIPIDRRLLQGKGYKEVEDKGKKFWELSVRLTLRYCEMDVKIGYEILKPVESRDGDSDAEEELPEDVAFRIEETLWDASHSEFAS